MSQLQSYIKKLKQSSLERKIPNISERNADFLQKYLHEKKPQHILEIGTANGYSTLVFFEALAKISNNFDITTIEHAQNAHTEAIEHFANCKAKNIHAIW
jgi:predicted O-methyltransferase YrrM